MVLVKCLLDFPEKFFAACSFAMSPPDGAHGVTDDSRLLLYALYQQALEGPNTTAKPWGWNRFELLKWNAWSELYEMPSQDAMEMYVATLEEENPNWWALMTNYSQSDKVKEVSLQATMAALEVLGGPEVLEAAMAEDGAKLEPFLKFEIQPAGHSMTAPIPPMPTVIKLDEPSDVQDIRSELAVGNSHNEDFSTDFPVPLITREPANDGQQQKMLTFAEENYLETSALLGAENYTAVATLATVEENILPEKTASQKMRDALRSEQAEQTLVIGPPFEGNKQPDLFALALDKIESQGRLVAELVSKIDEKSETEKLSPYLLEQAMKQLDLQSEKILMLENMAEANKSDKAEDKGTPILLSSAVSEIQSQGANVYELLQNFGQAEKPVLGEEVVDQTLARSLIDMALKEIRNQSDKIQTMQASGPKTKDAEFERVPPPCAGDLFQGLKLRPDSWEEMPLRDVSKVPLPRQRHSATVIGRRMYVIGGSYGGRSLNDIQVLDLATGDWFRMNPLHGTMPYISCHRCVEWEGKLLVVGGFIRDDEDPEMTVIQLDVVNQVVETVATIGTAPCVRGGHTAVVVGNRLIVFGGEQSQQGDGPLNDLHILNLPSKEWTEPIVSGEVPASRVGHASCVLDSTLFIFGGTTTTKDGKVNYLSDLHSLDTRKLFWSQPPSLGPVPPGNLGAGVCRLGQEPAFVLAGGVGKEGCSQDLHVLHVSMGQALRWTKIDTAPLLRGGEGVAMCCCMEGPKPALVVYGGYDGRYNKAAATMLAGHVLEAAASASGGFRTHASLAQAVGSVESDLSDLQDLLTSQLKHSPKDASEVVKASAEDPGVAEYLSVLSEHQAGLYGEDLSRQAADACRDAVREAAVTAAKEGARLAAKETRGPGQAAAVAVSSAVDAAAQTAHKQMLAAASYYERRHLSTTKDLEQVKDETNILIRVQGKEREHIEELKIELSRMREKEALDMSNLKQSHDQEIKLVSERLRKEMANLKTEHASEIHASEEELRKSKKNAFAKENMQVSEITVLKLENQKLQRALKGMEDLEKRVANLMNDGAAEKSVAASTSMLDRMTNFIDKKDSQEKLTSTAPAPVNKKIDDAGEVYSGEPTVEDIKPSSIVLDNSTNYPPNRLSLIDAMNASDAVVNTKTAKTSRLTLV